MGTLQDQSWAQPNDICSLVFCHRRVCLQLRAHLTKIHSRIFNYVFFLIEQISTFLNTYDSYTGRGCGKTLRKRVEGLKLSQEIFNYVAEFVSAA